MDRALSVASYLYAEYLKKVSSDMSEMRMHKLMYFLQRESLIELGTVLFDEPFHGWKFGPVLKSVRSAYMEAKQKNMPLFFQVDNDVSKEAKKLVGTILERYGGMSAWKLSALSHDEFSWILSRKGLKPDETGDVELSLNAMKCDALREYVKRRKQA